MKTFSIPLSLVVDVEAEVGGEHGGPHVLRYVTGFPCIKSFCVGKIFGKNLGKNLENFDKKFFGKILACVI